MKRWLPALLAIVFLMGCSPAKDTVLGKWQVINAPSEVAVFQENGTVELSDAAGSMSGKYSLLDENMLKLELVGTDGNELRPKIYVVSFEPQKMTWTDVGGVKTELQRVRD